MEELFAAKSQEAVRHTMKTHCESLHKSFLARRHFPRSDLDADAGDRPVLGRLANPAHEVDELLSTKGLSRVDVPELFLLNSLLASSHPRANRMGDGSAWMLGFTTLLLAKALDLNVGLERMREVLSGLGAAADAALAVLLNEGDEGGDGGEGGCDFTFPLDSDIADADNAKCLVAWLATAMRGRAARAGLEVAARARGGNRAHALSKMNVRVLALKLLRAFLSSVDERGGASVAYQKYVGRGSGCVELLPGTVFLDLPPHPALVRRKVRPNETPGAERSSF